MVPCRRYRAGVAAPTQVPALRFRLFGIPVEVQAAFFLIIGLLGFTGDFTDLLMWVGIAFVSILLHELGHAIAAKAFGSPTSIVLYGFGGLTSHRPTSAGRDLVVTLAGPFAGLAVGGLIYLGANAAEPLHGDVETAVFYALWINIGWGLINLLPVLPLDGGNALRSTIKLFTGVDREMLVRKISIACAVLGGAYALKLGLFFTAVLAVFFIGENMKALREDAHSRQLKELVAAGPALARGDSASVLAAADKVLAERPYPDVVATALQIKAWAYLGDHDAKRAADMIDALPSGHNAALHLLGVIALANRDTDRGLAYIVDGFLSGSPVLPQILSEYVVDSGCLQQLDDRLALLDPEVAGPAFVMVHAGLHQAGRYREAIDYGTAVYAGHTARGDLVAYNIACSLARLGENDQALDWLTTAFREGFADAATVDSDDDLAPLRGDPRFAAVRARLGQ